MKRLKRKIKLCSQKIKRDQGGIKLCSPGAFARDTGGGEGEGGATAGAAHHLSGDHDQDGQVHDGQNYFDNVL